MPPSTCEGPKFSLTPPRGVLFHGRPLGTGKRCATVSKTSRSTVRATLDILSPSDPIHLPTVVDGPFKTLPRDVHAWFSPVKDNRVEITKSSTKQRDEFFGSVLADARRPPNQFPDRVKRRRRVLEELSIIPYVEPWQLSEAELAVQEGNDQRAVTLLKWRLGPMLTGSKRRGSPRGSLCVQTAFDI